MTFYNLIIFNIYDINVKYVITIILFFSQFRHVHVTCDGDTSEQTMLEKRGMYICRICKHGPSHGRSHNPSGGSANSCSPIQSASSGIKDEDIGWNENSLLGDSADKDILRGTSLTSDTRGISQSLQGVGRGKPMSAMSHGGLQGFQGKRRRLGMVGRPPGSGGFSPNSGFKPGAMSEKPHGHAVTTAAAAIASKKRGENRKKGISQSGVARGRGMVALQVSLIRNRVMI